MSEQLPSYKTVTEVFDWGPAISKIIIKWPEIIESEMVNKETFKVYVRRILHDGAYSPSLTEKKEVSINLGSTTKSENDLNNYREITNVYISDEKGIKQQKSQYITIEMSVHPNNNLCSVLNYDLNSLYNNFVYHAYTITQLKQIKNNKNLIIENYKGNIRPIVDKFKFTHKNINLLTYGYAYYKPNDNEKHPLIIWLHGLGEGGSDNPALPIMANKANMFADESLQKYFNGAYVLVPQSPTSWIHSCKHFFGDGNSIYEITLMDLIKSFIDENPNIDKSRIYIGGDSNGGYMTMLLIRDYPDFFAAAFPVCEALRNGLISDNDIINIAKTPLWFVAAKTDNVIPPKIFAIPTVERLRKIGANVHFTLFDDVHDTSGLYKKEDGKPYEYNGHWSWIYVYNDQCEDVIDGKKVKLMEWLASQKKIIN
jgi:predicted peptidase